MFRQHHPVPGKSLVILHRSDLRLVSQGIRLGTSFQHILASKQSRVDPLSQSCLLDLSQKPQPHTLRHIIQTARCELFRNCIQNIIGSRSVPKNTHLPPKKIITNINTRITFSQFWRICLLRPRATSESIPKRWLCRPLSPTSRLKKPRFPLRGFWVA